MTQTFLVADTKNGIGGLDWTISVKDGVFARYGDTLNNTFSGVRLPGRRIRSSFGMFYAQDQGSGTTSRLSNNRPYNNYGPVSQSGDQLHTSTGFAPFSS